MNSSKMGKKKNAKITALVISASWQNNVFISLLKLQNYSSTQDLFTIHKHIWETHTSRHQKVGMSEWVEERRWREGQRWGPHMWSGAHHRNSWCGSSGGGRGVWLQLSHRSLMGRRWTRSVLTSAIFKPSDRGRNIAQQCGSHKLAATIIIKKAKPHNHEPTSPHL